MPSRPSPIRRPAVPLAAAVIGALLAALLPAVLPAVGAGAGQSGHPSLAQLQAQAAALKVQLNLAVAQDGAVMAELNRLSRLVSAEQAAVAAAQSAAAAADVRVQEEARRLADTQARGRAARQALVDRAVELYEHPFQDASVLLDGTSSLDQLTERQVLAAAVEGNTADLIDAVRQQELQQRAASVDLAAAKQQADARHAAAVAESQRLQTALGSEQAVHAALQTRIHDDDAQLAGLQPQIAAQIAAANAAQAARLAALAAAQGNGAPVLNPVLGPVGSYGLQWPIAGIVTQEFGHNGHPGIDIAAAYGTPIHASGTGVVIYAGWESGYGNYTCIAHTSTISTCYGHQSAIYVHVGETVTRGQVIGAEGSTGYSTGPHVHFEVRVNGAVRNPRLFIPGNP